MSMPWMQNMKVEAFKEPRGFIKVLQWVFAICAFATTVNFSTEYGFRITCTGLPNASSNAVTVIRQVAEYPFELDRLDQNISICGTFTQINFVGNAKSDAEFFVTTGVLTFLYSLAAALFYLLAENVYQTNNKLPLIDFGVTLVLAVFWLSGSAAWAKGVDTLSSATNPEAWYKEVLPQCANTPQNTCDQFIPGHFSKLVISILFGFINFVLWGGNLWFLYKETTWFESIMKNTATSAPQQMSP